jgi:hypothetical protein
VAITSRFLKIQTLNSKHFVGDLNLGHKYLTHCSTKYLHQPMMLVYLMIYKKKVKSHVLLKKIPKQQLKSMVYQNIINDFLFQVPTALSPLLPKLCV